MNATRNAMRRLRNQSSDLTKIELLAINTRHDANILAQAAGQAFGSIDGAPQILAGAIAACRVTRIQAGSPTDLDAAGRARAICTALETASVHASERADRAERAARLDGERFAETALRVMRENLPLAATFTAACTANGIEIAGDRVDTTMLRFRLWLVGSSVRIETPAGTAAH